MCLKLFHISKAVSLQIPYIIWDLFFLLYWHLFRNIIRFMLQFMKLCIIFINREQFKSIIFVACRKVQYFTILKTLIGSCYYKIAHYLQKINWALFYMFFVLYRFMVLKKLNRQPFITQDRSKLFGMLVSCERHYTNFEDLLESETRKAREYHIASLPKTNSLHFLLRVRPSYIISCAWETYNQTTLTLRPHLLIYIL